MTTTQYPAVDTAAAPTRRRRKPMTPARALRILLKTVFGIVTVALALFPLAWMVIAGFKTNTEVTRTPFQFFPDVWQLDNYRAILDDPAFIRTLAITGLGAVLFTALSLTVNSLAAYAFARLEFSGKRILWVIVISTMFIPGMTILLTSFIVVTKLHMLDTLAVLILPGAAAAVHIFFIRQFYLNIPSSLEEAAMWQEQPQEDLEASGQDDRFGPSRPGETWLGALVAHTELQPGETRTVRFVLAWWFPNRMVDFVQFGPDRP